MGGDIAFAWISLTGNRTTVWVIRFLAMGINDDVSLHPCCSCSGAPCRSLPQWLIIQGRPEGNVFAPSARYTVFDFIGAPEQQLQPAPCPRDFDVLGS